MFAVIFHVVGRCGVTLSKGEHATVESLEHVLARTEGEEGETLQADTDTGRVSGWG